MDDDQDYYLGRAEAELTLAQQSTIPAAVKAHYLLASHYLDLVYSGETAETAPPRVQPGERSGRRA